MKNTYRNSIRSKEMIRKSLINLFNANKNINEITVTDVVKEANINRGTFYNHYSNVTEVFEEMKDELISNLIENIKLAQKQNNIDSFILALNENVKQNEKIYRKLVTVIPRSIIDDIKVNFIEQILYLEPNIEKITLCFLVNGISGIYIDYLENKIACSIEDLGKKSTEILKNYL